MLRCVLHCFEVVLGLRLNLGKSTLFAIGEVPNLDQLATDVECKQGRIPTTYVGLPPWGNLQTKGGVVSVGG